MKIDTLVYLKCILNIYKLSTTTKKCLRDYNPSCQCWFH